MNPTKEKILEVALNMFAKSGYSSVSIRDICKQVEIKESSIYYHFKNKQAIFDELIFQFESSATSMMTMLETSLTTQGQFGEKLELPEERFIIISSPKKIFWMP